MDGEDAVAIVDDRERVDLGPFEQVPPQAPGALVGREAGRQNQRAPAAGLQEPQAALEEQLIQVGVAAALQAVLAGSPGVGRQTPLGIAAFRFVQDVPRRVAKHDVESRRVLLDAVIPVEHLGELHRPVEYSRGSRDAPGVREERLERARRQRAPTPQHVVEQRAERAAIAGDALVQPGGAPQVRGLPPSGQGAVFAFESRERPFLSPDLLEAVVRSFGDLPSHADRRLHRRGEIVGGEERQVARPPRTTGKRLADDIRHRRPDQAVADAQPVIEERQRLVGGERRQPHGQPRQLHGHRIDVDAEQAALRHRPPETRPILLGQVGRGHRPLLDQRLLVGLRQIAARGHEERAAPHRRIHHAQRKDLVWRPSLNHGGQAAPDDEFGEGAGRVEGSGGLAAPGGDQPRPRRVLGRDDEVEQVFVDGAELLYAEVGVGDAPAALRRGPRGQRQDRLAHDRIAQGHAGRERRTGR